MAEKFTLLELHLHSDDNEFRSDVQLSSDLGSLLGDRLGLSGATGATDGGDAVEIGTTEEEEDDEGDTDSAVVEIDTDAHEAAEEETADEDESDDDEESGGGLGRKLFTVALLAAVVYLARQYMGNDEFEEFDDEFEEFGDDFDSDTEFDSAE